MTNTTHEVIPAVFHSKNNSCTSWVFLLVLLNFFFVQKHQQRHITGVNHETQQKTIMSKIDEQPIETCGVGDD